MNAFSNDRRSCNSCTRSARFIMKRARIAFSHERQREKHVLRICFDLSTVSGISGSKYA